MSSITLPTPARLGRQHLRCAPVTTLPTLTVGFPPGPHTVELARLAEDVGYDRVWLFDSAGLYEDIWIWLALAARETSVKLGTAVLVPNLRHVMTTAAAIATLEGLAPGRTAYGFGTGATARWVLGKSGLSWATTRRYIETLRALLHGEVVEIDGARTQMLHHADLARPRDRSTCRSCCRRSARRARRSRTRSPTGSSPSERASKASTGASA